MQRQLKHLSRILVVLSVIALLLIPFVSVFAIDPPDSTTLRGCNAYQNLLETGDMLFLMHYDIDYSVWPTDETVNSAYYTTLTNAGTGVDIALSDIYANPYYHNGFGQGMNSMYFTANEASILGLTWSANYTMRMVANASANWSALPAPVSQSIVWSGTGLSTRVLFIMNQLQNQWGINLLDSGTLTAYGENYAISTIPNLRLFAPTIFSSYTIPIDYDTERTHPKTFALLLRNQWVGTWLDLTTVSADWGVDASWIYALIWLVGMVGVGWVTVTVGSHRMPGVEIVGTNNKPLFYVEVLMLMWGGLMGFMPWLAVVLSGFILALMILNQLFFSKALT